MKQYSTGQDAIGTTAVINYMILNQQMVLEQTSKQLINAFQYVCI
jgi:hypothetical protein